MPDFIYRAGVATGRDDDERRAYLKAFGMSLKLKRTARGLSQEEFGELIGLHRTFVGLLERGKRGINIAELPGIARALGVRQADLLPEAVDDLMRSPRRPAPGG
jgi:transcriptional regulator with XRE-family HTH domain